jgi:hypothetical protein
MIDLFIPFTVPSKTAGSLPYCGGAIEEKDCINLESCHYFYAGFAAGNFLAAACHIR